MGEKSKNLFKKLRSITVTNPGNNYEVKLGRLREELYEKYQQRLLQKSKSNFG